MVCLCIADKILTDIDYDNWFSWTSWLTSANGPSMSADRAYTLEDVITYINAATWPQHLPQIEAAFKNFAAVLSDLLKQFFKYSERTAATPNLHTTARFYRIPDDNPNYDKDLAEYNKHLDIVSAYTFELTKAINYVCDMIRENIDPTYRAIDGKRYITNGYEQGGFRNYIPEYSNEELKDGKSPYLGAEEFLKRYKYGDKWVDEFSGIATEKVI